MSISDTTTYKAATSKRPAIADIRYAVKANDAEGGPIPTDGPSAEEWNQISESLAGVCATGAAVSLSVTNGATPVVASMASARDDLLVDDLTMASSGTGICEITWAAGKLPVPSVKPQATVNGTTPGFIATELITNGIRVRTWNASAVATYLDFTVSV